MNYDGSNIRVLRMDFSMLFDGYVLFFDWMKGKVALTSQSLYSISHPTSTLSIFKS